MNELEIIRHSRIPGMTVFFNTVDYRTPHFHPEWELIWLLDNPMTVSGGGGSFRAEKGDLLLFQPSEPHELHKVEENCTFLCLQVSPELLRLENDLVVEPILLNPFLGEQAGALRSTLLAVAQAYLNREQFSNLFCVGQACLMFHQILNAVPVRAITREERISQEKRNKRLTSLIRFVDENYMHKIRLSDFAEAEGFSMSYLSHFIKSTLNQSFQEYVNSVRVNCACKLISGGEEKLTAVCMASGFSDYRYFSSAFKKQFGMTPEQYKLSLKKPENAVIHHSIHSLERFYTDEQSRAILAELRRQQNNCTIPASGK
ncbi:MAG: AraC family transcriptional regulator [Firmicutes bacterium]|nr:AraC family transcriptional regulator [Bacillota bacterium]MDY6159253.1 AraC family transcriptional regulator [Candidatus Faecousia sp.]